MGIMVNFLLKELLLFNGIALAMGVLLYALGWSPINAISLSLFLLCALLFVVGGAMGFLISSASFDYLKKFLRLGGSKSPHEGKNESGMKKNDAKEKQVQIDLAKHMIIVGTALFVEALLFAMAYMLLTGTL